MRYVWVGIGGPKDGEGTWVNPLKVERVKPRRPGPGCTVVMDSGERWTSDDDADAMAHSLALASSRGVVLEDVEDHAYMTLERVLWQTFRVK